MVEDKPFEQPEIDLDTQFRKISLKNTEIQAPFRAYAVVQFEPSKRFGAIQLKIEKGKVIEINQFMHLEIEKEFAELNLIKLIKFEERIYV